MLPMFNITEALAIGVVAFLLTAPSVHAVTVPSPSDSTPSSTSSSLKPRYSSSMGSPSKQRGDEPPYLSNGLEGCREYRYVCPLDISTDENEMLTMDRMEWVESRASEVVCSYMPLDLNVVSSALDMVGGLACKYDVSTGDKMVDSRDRLSLCPEQAVRQCKPEGKKLPNTNPIHISTSDSERLTRKDRLNRFTTGISTH